MSATVLPQDSTLETPAFLAAVLGAVLIPFVGDLAYGMILVALLAGWLMVALRPSKARARLATEMTALTFLSVVIVLGVTGGI